MNATQVDRRIEELYNEQRQALMRRTDRMFGWLLLGEWIAGILLALIVSPTAWAGKTQSIHAHVWAALLLGGAITGLPVVLAWKRPGWVGTRYTIACAQVLWSALLIHLTGGRIETHFHVFGSLAFLAFYREWRLLIPATVIVAADHFLRGVFWPESAYGILSAEWWRFLEHALWVVFEDVFLVLACVHGVREMKDLAAKRAQLEATNVTIENEVRQRTAALASSEERFRSLSASSPMGIFQTNATGSLVYANERLQHIAGLETAAMLGRHWTEVFRPEGGSTAPEDSQAALAAGRNYEVEYPMTGRWLRICIARLGSDGACVGTVEDVTQRRRAEEALRDSEAQRRHLQKMEAMGRLAGGVAHDFNNLLTAILGYSDLLLEGAEPGTRPELEEIKKSGLRASSLTQQLLAFSRKQVMVANVTDLNTIVSNMEKMLLRLIHESIELRFLPSRTLPLVKVDPGQIEQVIMNLVVNARDAISKGGRITIETSTACIDEKDPARPASLRAGDYVILSVSDTGGGMSQETQSHLFEPFFTTKDRGKGTGLGLATVYGIIQQSRGHIEVLSAIGEGTTFRVYLPQTNEQEGKSGGAAARPVPKGRETILLVEDEPVVLSLTTAVLQRNGYRVVSAREGEEALRIAKNHVGSIGLVLTDVVMPGLNGRQLANRLASVLPRVPVLYMSGYTGDAMAEHGVLDSDESFIRKPFSPDGLAKKVREVLDRETATKLDES